MASNKSSDSLVYPAKKPFTEFEETVVYSGARYEIQDSFLVIGHNSHEASYYYVWRSQIILYDALSFSFLS